MNCEGCGGRVRTESGAPTDDGEEARPGGWRDSVADKSGVVSVRVERG